MGAIGLVAVLLIGVAAFAAIVASRPGSDDQSQASAFSSDRVVDPTATAVTNASYVKATAIMQEQLAQATAIANPAKPTKPPKPMTPTPDGMPPARPETGVLDMHQSAASVRGYFVSNVWQGPSGDGVTYLQVSAGARKEQTGAPSTVGIVAIAILAPDDSGSFVSSGDVEAYEAPGNSGPLTIISVDDDSVVMETSAGDTVIFNLASRSFN